MPRQGLRQPGQSSRGLGTFPCQPLLGVLRGLAMPQPQLLSQANHPKPFPASHTLSKWAPSTALSLVLLGTFQGAGNVCQMLCHRSWNLPPGNPSRLTHRRCQEGPPVPSGVQSIFRCLTSSPLKPGQVGGHPSSVLPMERERPRSRGFLPPFLWS